MTCALCPRTPSGTLNVPDLGTLDVCDTHRTKLRGLSFGWPLRHTVPQSGWRPVYDDGYPVRLVWSAPARKTVCGLPLRGLGDEEVGAPWEATCEGCSA